MHRQKGTQNTPQSIINEIVKRHRAGTTVKTLAEEYGKPFKTIKNCVQEKTTRCAGKKKARSQQNRAEENQPHFCPSTNMKISV